MDISTFLLATAVAHVCFTVFVIAHGRITNRSLGWYPVVTLLLGLAGLAAYFFYEADG